MFEDLTKAVSEFKKAKSTLFFTPAINTVDKAVAIIALAKTCLEEGKSFQIICPKILTNSIENLFVEEGLEVKNELGSKDYIVSVDYGSAAIEKVICKRDEDSKKLNFVITPKDEIFNFDNVELISGTSTFDLVFTFGLKKLDEDLDSLFGNASVISITKRDWDIGKYKFLINGQKSYSEVIFEFVKAFSSTLKKETLEILLKGVVSKYNLLENGDNDGWILAAKFIKYGADFNKVSKKLNYSKDCANLELQRKVMANVVKNPQARVLWSKVEVPSDLNENNLDLRGRIIFNISKDFDLAFVLYILDKDRVKVVIESNDIEKYSALSIAKAFSAKGYESRAVLNSRETPAEDFEKKFFEELELALGVNL